MFSSLLLLIYLLLFSLIWAAKVLISFELRKKYAKFSASFYVFFQKRRFFTNKMSNFAPEKEINSIFNRLYD